MKNYDYLPLFEKTGNGEVGFTVGMIIKASLDTAWRAICKAENVKKFFTSDARRDLDKGGEVLWAWGEEAALINVLEVEPQKRLLFEWNGYKVDYKIRTEFTLEEQGSRVLVKIKESGWEMNKDGVKSSLANCNGWSDYLNALKVHLEYNIDYLK
jgi:uncharacterized protein YndB with AHSA1/START domain